MDKFKNIKIASVLGVVGNLFLFIIKFMIGVFTQSQAMLADSFNSLGDVLSSIMTFLGNKIASKQADEDHNSGHGKAEYIYSMLIAVVMFFLVLEIFVSSVSSFFYENDYVFSKWLVLVCIITIIVKFCLFIYTKKISKRYDSLLLEANSKDHRNDCVVSLFTLFSFIGGMNGLLFIDGVVGIGIALWIFMTAWDIFRQSYDVLMDKAIGEETKNKVLKIVEKKKEILKISHFNSIPVGFQYQISFTIFVDGNMSTFFSHEIANQIEEEIAAMIPEIYLTVIHVNPM